MDTIKSDTAITFLESYKIAPKKAILTNMPLRIEDDSHFTVLAENLANAIRFAKKAIGGTTIKPYGLVMYQDTGEHWAAPAETLLEIAELAGDPVMKIEIDSKMGLLNLKHGRSKTQIKMAPVAGPYMKPIAITDQPVDLTPPDKWIGKAVYKKSDRYFQENEIWKTQHWGNFAGDGFRAHQDSRLERVSHDDEDIKIPEETEKKIYDLFEKGRQADRSCVINWEQFNKAVKAASKISKETIHVDFRQGGIEVWARSEETGTVSTFCSKEYIMGGSEVDILIDPEYLLDALSGMQPPKQPKPKGKRTMLGSAVETHIALGINKENLYLSTPDRYREALIALKHDDVKPGEKGGKADETK